jgi:DNA-binding NarL/FixJ family response regulator
MLLESENLTQVVTSVVADRPRVVVADDDPIARQVIVQMMNHDESLDLVGVAGSVDEVTELVQRLQPDVVVLDWNMPGGGGPQATVRILGLHPATQVIAFTSSEGPEAMVEMMRAGARDVVVKGCPAERLSTSIQRVLAA